MFRLTWHQFILALTVISVIILIAFEVRGALVEGEDTPSNLVAMVCSPDGDGGRMCWVVRSDPQLETVDDCYAMVKHLRTSYAGFTVFGACVRDDLANWNLLKPSF